ncbi:MAG: DUF4440 domain-containing protein [Dehalococcoidia bacterium]|nr:DUF4440 domain-containing protein [Dehalococcoidia bacterium]
MLNFRSACGRSLLVAMAGAALLVGLVACSADGDPAPSLSQPEQAGQSLTNEYITLLAQKDLSGLQSFLSDGFMIQRADGSFATKTDYLTNIPSIGQFTIANVSAKQAGDTLVVRWFLTVDEVINGQSFASTPAPRLSTFVWTDGEWRLLSHANFNAPATSPPAAPTQ